MTEKDVYSIDLSKVDTATLDYIYDKLVDFQDTFKYLSSTGAEQLYWLLETFRDKINDESLKRISK